MENPKIEDEDENEEERSSQNATMLGDVWVTTSGA
jgi:hypothetical protein